MNKSEMNILNKPATAVTHSNIYAWDQLKWEIYEYGYQTGYPAQSFFDDAAKIAIQLLTYSEHKELVRLWNESSPKRKLLSDDEIHERNAQMIIEIIVSRAKSAAYRTINW